MSEEKIKKNFHINHQLSTMDLLRRVLSLGVVLQLLGNIGLCNGAIKSIRLVIEPSAVRRGQSATLKCLYDLDGAPLLSLQFYRGSGEFYRFSPTQSPNKKTFPLSAITVDLAASNATQVVIKNVSFGLSGNFTCEVTADSTFSTATAFATMSVVELPESRPTLWTEYDRYEPGDVLKANCSSPPSRPQAELTLTINNIVVYSADTQYHRTIEGRTSSRINMRLQLQSIHFGGGNSIMHGNGQLVLRCTAQIGNFYQEYTEKELGIPQKDPIPARVTSSIGVETSRASLLFTIIAVTLVTMINKYSR